MSMRLHEGLAVEQPSAQVAFRLLSRVREGYVSNLPTPCWLWEGATDRKGYGTIRVGKKIMWVHRVSYALFRGPIPDGLTVNHRCFTPGCVNPHHLELLDHKDNSGTKAPGEVECPY